MININKYMIIMLTIQVILKFIKSKIKIFQSQYNLFIKANELEKAFAVRISKDLDCHIDEGF